MTSTRGVLEEQKISMTLNGLFNAGWRLLLRPGRAFESSVAAARSHPLMMVAFFLGSLPTAEIGEAESAIDPWSYVFAAGTAIFTYYLGFRILDWSARFLGGEKRFERLRWMCLLLEIPYASMALIFHCLLWLKWAEVGSMWFWGAVFLAEALFDLWIAVVSVLVMARLYDFSAGRTLMAGLLPFVALYLPGALLAGVLYLVDL